MMHESGATAEPADLWLPERPDIVSLLETASIDDVGLIPWGSNATVLITLRHDDAGASLAMYKPVIGEVPLYDFPDGSLYKRERAAYVISEALGWGLVPPTVVRDGPYGIGMVQLYIDADINEHYFTFGPEIPAIARRIALFDLLTNNADRKAGHVLRGPDARVWAIDHGLTFHRQDKVRTVIWDFSGQEFDAGDRQDLEKLLQDCLEETSVWKELVELLAPREFQALSSRLFALIQDPVYPHPDSYRSVPWPPV